MTDRLHVAGVGVYEQDAIKSAVPLWQRKDAPQLTLTVVDRDRRLRDHPKLNRPAHLEPVPLGDIFTAEHAGTRWVATAAAWDDDGRATVTLEHYISSMLRSRSELVTAAKSTERARFNYSLLTLRGKAKWRTVCPEADGLIPPVLDAAVVSQIREQEAERDAQRAPGFAAGASFKIGWPAPGRTANASQRRVLATAMAVADELKAGPKARMALICALSVESAATNLAGGHSTSEGPLQQLASTERTTGVDSNDVAGVCRVFLRKGFVGGKGAIQLERENPTWSAGRIAQACQGSAYPTRYGQVEPQAQVIMDAWGGSTGTTTETADSRGAFTTDGKNWWEVTGTSADEVGRSRFIGQNRGSDALYWLADTTIATSRPYLTVAPHDSGVKLSNPSVDELMRIDSLTVKLLAPKAACGDAIGRRVQVADFGSASGDNWVSVEATRSGRDDRWIAVKLERPRNPTKKAPVSTDASAPTATGSSITSNRTVPEKVQRVISFIDRVTAKKRGYLWGGYSINGYDCSGFASAVKDAMGLGSERLTTGPFSTWGQAGEGQYVTFWVKETGNARASHMYVTVKTGGRLRVAEAGGIRGALTGWRGAESAAKRPGFEPRHAEGW